MNNKNFIFIMVFFYIFSISFMLINVIQAGEKELKLPTKIELTKEDIEEMKHKGTLRGRPVSKHTSSPGIWNGIQVFTGKKSDILNWFRSGQEGLEADGQEIYGSKSEWVSIRTLQYELLCGELLQTGDIDIIRTVLWNTELKGAWPSGYLDPDWRKLEKDNRLTVAEQIVAWERSRRKEGSLNLEGINEFWKFYGDRINSKEILEITAGGRPFPWDIFGRKYLPIEKTEQILLPLIRREYLSISNRGVDNKPMIENVLYQLNRLYDNKNLKYSNMLLDKLMEWDKLEDRRSVVLWKGLPSPHHYDKTLIEKVYLFMRTANVAENATKAFYKFGRSKQRQIIMEDKRDWQKLFEEYLEVAFSKKDDNKETQKQIQIEFLEALTGSNDENGKFKKDDSFLQFLREGKVELEVTAEQKKLLKSAWRHVPEALNHVKVKK